MSHHHEGGHQAALRLSYAVFGRERGRESGRWIIGSGRPDTACEPAVRRLR